MKVVIAIFLSVFVFNVLAVDYFDYKSCDGILPINDILDLQENESLSLIFESDFQSTESEFLASPLAMMNFTYNACANSLSRIVFVDFEGNEYSAVYTSDDNCDGGNTYGYIINRSSHKVVAHILDGDVECLR